MLRFASLCLGLLVAALLAATTTAASAQGVTVRVEGASQALVPNTAVDPSAVGELTRDGQSCQGTNTAAGALELAAQSDWDAKDGDFGHFLTRIKGETYDGDQRYWSIVVNDESAQQGLCQQPVAAGDELVLAVECADGSAEGCYTGGRLNAAALPERVAPGTPVTVTVKQTIETYGSPTERAPAANAQITGGGTTATTGEDGTAALTLNQRGPVSLRITRERQVPEQIDTCVSDGNDGFCGSPAPAPPKQPAPSGPIAGPDRTAPTVKIAGIRDGQRFGRRRAPRRLRASVSDPSGVLQVKLALHRKSGKRCYSYSGKRKRFIRNRCGTSASRFRVPAGDVSYRLRKRLPRGRYVFDVIAVDKARNRDTLVRGRNRVTFRVR